MQAGLSSTQSLQLVASLIKSCQESSDPGIQLWYCQSADETLSTLKKSVNRNSLDSQERQLREDIGCAYFQLAKVATGLDAKLVKKWGEKAEKWAPGLKTGSKTSSKNKKWTEDIATLPDNIFPRNTRAPTLPWTYPKVDAAVKDTPELVSSLTLLHRASEKTLHKNSLDENTLKWLDDTEVNEDEKTRLKSLARQLSSTFIEEKIKDKEAVAEIVVLAPVLTKDDFRRLLGEFIDMLKMTSLLDLNILAGLAQLIKDAPPDTLHPQDLVTILDVVSSRLQATHSQAKDHVHTLVVTVNDILGAMADQGVSKLDKVELHEPLLNFLVSLWDSSDPHIVYHARSAYQALLCVPDNEPLWKARLKRVSNVATGVVSVAAGIHGLDTGNLLDGLDRLQEEFKRAGEFVLAVRSSYAHNDLMTSLKEGFKRKNKEPWYSALRSADEFLKLGELVDFRKLVCEAPFRRHQWFLWGICERLGNLAANKQSVWESMDQHGAVLLLCEIYKDDTTWGSLPDLKKYILDILQQLSSPTIDVPEARASFYELSTNGGPEKQILYQECEKAGPSNYHIKTGISRFAVPSMLDRVQGKADVKADLRRMARRKASEKREASYIPPRAKDNLQASDDTAVDLAETVAGFLKSDRKVLLLLGDSGVGKTTFNKFLELHLWSQYLVREGSIPLFISLSAIERPDTDLIPKQLRKLGFKENQIRGLRDRHFILICDGYDESQQVRNLYTSNHFNQPDHWRAQMIISCRTEYLPTDYQGRFDPGDEGTEEGQSLFQQAVVSPFNDIQIYKYMEKYVDQNNLLWKLSDYLRVMEKIPSLQELVKNPYLLSIALEVLPRLADPGQDIEAEKITRVRIYDEFMALWLERGRKKFEEDKELSHEQKKAFQSLCNDGFVQSGMDFIRDLAVAIFEKQHGKTTVEYSKKIDKGYWKDRFFSLDGEVPILCNVCPLNRNGNQIQFIHRSILEYGLSLAIFNPALEQEGYEVEEQAPSLKRRGSIASRFSFEVDEYKEDLKRNRTEDEDLDSPLFKRSYLKERSIIQLLVERVQQDTTGCFKQRLFGYITKSAEAEEYRTAAANAMTVLVRAGVCFSHENLKGIRIPGADLSFGIFDSTQLQEADLRMTNLQGAWLRKTDLGRSRMEGAQFGEWPALTHEKMEGTFAYSPDGKLLMALTEEGVLMYHTSTWTLASLPTSIKEEAEAKIATFAFSPDSSLIAAGRDDNSVVVWRAKTGMMVTMLEGHADLPRDVAFAPEKGHQFATCGNDSTVRLWDKSPFLQGSGDWKAGLVLRGHRGPVLTIKYDKGGNIIASCGNDKSVRIWDLASRMCIHILTEHTGQVAGISFSPANSSAYRQLSSFAFDHSIKLWNADTGVCEHTLQGHKATIRAVSYSPKGNYLVSASSDCTIRVWDTLTGRLVNTIQVHAQVNDVVYSPNGLQIAAACDDSTVRLWHSEDWTTPGPILSGHSDGVKHVSYAPDGFQLASSGWDESIRLWVSVTSNQQQYRRHRSEVTQVSRLEGGKFIVSRCKDSVRIWNDATGSLRHSLPNNLKITVMATSPCGLQFATAGTADNIIRLWEPQSGQCKLKLYDSKERTVAISSSSEQMERITDIAYSSDGYRLASGCLDGMVRIWNWRDGTLIHRLKNSNKGTHLVFSPSGSGLLATAESNIIQIWDVVKGVRLHKLYGNQNTIEKLAFSSEGDFITTAAVDGYFRTWSTQSGALTLTLNHGFAKPALMTADASKGVMVSSNGLLSVYDFLQKKRLWELPSSGGRAAVALSPDGRLLVHSAKDGLLVLWDITNGKSVGQFKTLTNRITSLDWSLEEGKAQTKITVGHEEGDISVWSVVEMAPALTDAVVISAQQKYDFLLLWTSANKKLNVEGMSIEGVKGLSSTNARLLEQNDARGKPEGLWKKAQKVITMNKVISNLKKAVPVEE
ncbi:hypothetical protein EMPS_00163 [Entomortierella parvispora]|uniref:WD40 repeat-like protein n=1 Tax=Entomortierella parvispora TaxID=205924 RepID=A0A9P3H171_9FUNG|nr:hypothetical protein EMPS_00163 [Entomortierella parvispora]